MAFHSPRKHFKAVTPHQQWVLKFFRERSSQLLNSDGRPSINSSSDRDRGRQTLFLSGDWDLAGFFGRAFRAPRAAAGAAGATRLGGRLGLVLSRGSAIVSVGIGSTLIRI